MTNPTRKLAEAITARLATIRFHRPNVLTARQATLAAHAATLHVLGERTRNGLSVTWEAIAIGGRLVVFVEAPGSAEVLRRAGVALAGVRFEGRRLKGGVLAADAVVVVGRGDVPDGWFVDEG